MSKPREFWTNYMSMDPSLDGAKDRWPKAEHVDIRCYVEACDYDELLIEAMKLRVGLDAPWMTQDEANLVEAFDAFLARSK